MYEEYWKNRIYDEPKTLINNDQSSRRTINLSYEFMKGLKKEYPQLP